VTQFLLDVVSRFGYAIVGLGVGIESMGIPVPGETVLVVGAVLAGQGHLAPWGVALAGWIGAVAGDNIGYWVGRRWGKRLVQAPLVRRLWDERRVALAERYFARHGGKTVFLGRFVALLRIFAGPLAGMHGMPWGSFLVANAAGGAVWVASVVTVGVLLGSNLDRALNIVSKAGYGGLGVVLVVGGAVAVWQVRRRRRELTEGADLLAHEGEAVPPSEDVATADRR
jgi:membrane protein DedA with SNARE-associated domain